MLPTSRNETATNATPVNPNLINDIQDCVIGKKCPSSARTTLGIAGVGWSAPAGQVYALSTGPGTLLVPLPSETGDRITGLVLAAFGDGAVDVTYNLKKIGPTMAGPVTIGAIVDNNRAAAWGDVALVVTPAVMGVGETLYLEAIASAANARVGVIRQTYDRL